MKLDVSQKEYRNPSERAVVEAGRSLKGSTGIHVALALARNPVPPSREAAKIGVLPKGPPAVMSGRPAKQTVGQGDSIIPESFERMLAE